MRQKIFLLFVLLCAAAQGAWADTYDYPTKTKPEFHASYGGKSNVVVINTAAELAYITEHFYEDSGFHVDKDDWSQLDYYLNADIDMGTEHSWLPMGVDSNTGYSGKFWGNGHTITYYIWDLDEAGQGLFSTIHTYGRVYDVNVICKIFSHQSHVGGIAGQSWGHIENCTATVNILCHEVHCVGGIVGYTHSGAFVAGCHVMGRIECTGPSMQVGGITGFIDGAHITTVRNCWVEADIITDEAPSLYNADVGGIAGQNEYCVEYCCMTGNVTVKGKETGVGGIVGSNEKTVSHCTFYGTVSVNKDQKNKYVGGEAPAGSSDNMYDAFNQDEYNDAKSRGYDLYCQAINSPYAVNVKSYGIGGLKEINPRFRPGETVRLTVTSESRELKEISVKTVSGSDITVYCNSPSDYFFIMPARDVNVVAWFDHFDWPTEGEGTAEDPYTIRSSSEWGTFASMVATSEDDKGSFEGKYIRLDADLTVTEMIGYDDYHPFKGTFLGNGHTLTFNQNIYPEQDDIPWQGISPFHYINGATIKDLKVAGTITSQTVYTSGLVGFAKGNNLIENCVVTTTLNISSDYAGGIVGNGLNSTTTIKNCVFAGTINGVDVNRANIGGILGYCDGATPTLENCLEKGTYTNISSMHPMGLQGGSGTITNCYYKNPQVGEIGNADTFSGASQVYAITATAPVTIDDISGLGAATTTYGSNGITAYEKGIKYGGTFFVVSGEIVSLTLSHGNKAGYLFNQYAASAGTLENAATSTPTLIMPAADVTIGIEWTKNTASLFDNADNTTFINGHDGDVYDITLAGRTLYKDGKWNTLCLPFSVTIDGSPLAGATARPLAEASISGTTLNLTFGAAVTTLQAGTPYIIKWAKADGYDEASEDIRDIKNPVFNGVTIDAAQHDYDNRQNGDQRVRFVGTYAPLSFDAENKSILMMGAANTLYYPLAGASIGAQRAYFLIGDDATEPAAAPAARLTAFNINFGDSEATGILVVNGVNEVTGVNDNSWYTLDGRRLVGKPSHAGVYINKGIKVVIK